MKHYVDPQFRDATYQSIKNTETPQLVNVEVDFQVNGKTNKRQKTIVRRKVLRTLGATRIFAEAGLDNISQAGQLKICVNNVGDMGDAVGKGIATGLTFGLAGSHVVDRYIMTCVYTPKNGLTVTKEYKHALHSTIGVHKALEGMEPVPPADAFDQIVEEMLLNFLRDIQNDGCV